MVTRLAKLRCVPRVRPAQAILETDLRVEPDDVPRPRDIRKPPSCPLTLERHVPRLDRLPGNHGKHRGQLVDRRFLTWIPDVEDGAGSAALHRRGDRGCDRVIDVTERAALLAVSLNGERLSELEPTDELRDDVIEAHSRAVHVVVAENDELEAATPRDVRDRELAGDLASAV